MKVYLVKCLCDVPCYWLISETGELLTERLDCCSTSVTVCWMFLNKNKLS